MKPGKRSRTERAYSLIECLVFLSAISVLLGLTALLIQRLMRYEQADRQHVEAAASVERLARALRSDAHRSRTLVDLKPEQTHLALADGSTVAYTVEPKRIVRELTRVNKTKHYDVFQVPPRSKARFQKWEADGTAGGLEIHFEQPRDPSRPMDLLYRDLSVVAAIGRESRYEGEVKP